MIFNKFLTFSCVISLLFLFASCGGDEDDTGSKVNDDISGEGDSGVASPAEKPDVDEISDADENLIAEEEEEKVVPNPNG
ncbi:MAG: hypothetical protein EBW86_13805, partial [Rhodobacteraceae bacterium]|nr:hypothetical protein [Paracoccaceae bacterium]